MTRIIKQRQIVEDRWQFVADDQPLVGGPVIVTWRRWQAERESLLARGGEFGVRLPNTLAVSEVAGDLAHFSVIALEFPKFADGRAYSQARLLRERYGYKGELRAVGEVLRDQLFFMARTGFDAFQLKEGKSLEDALTAFDDFTVTYQPAADQPLPLYRRRGA
ncbi:MAG TPA: DUF934 domain-containing protein [Candidatus Competibacteraceae bacterium]|nr:DUF934 domain-containing protein [Candidatus Competibacteraceae bacterium]